jgi:hypothetical protein
LGQRDVLEQTLERCLRFLIGRENLTDIAPKNGELNAPLIVHEKTRGKLAFGEFLE